jgi:cytochrome c5
MAQEVSGPAEPVKRPIWFCTDRIRLCSYLHCSNSEGTTIVLKTVRFKKISAVFGCLPLLAITLNASHAVKKTPGASDIDPASIYRDEQCISCHGPRAGRFFDAKKDDNQLIETVLRGRRAETPPDMPAFGEKGMTTDQAKALVAYMKSLRK